MENYQAKILRDGLSFGEGPRWRDGRLWYSDFYRHAIYSVNAEGQDERLEHDVPGQPSGLGWLPDGDLLVVSMTDHQVLRIHFFVIFRTTAAFGPTTWWCPPRA